MEKQVSPVIPHSVYVLFCLEAVILAAYPSLARPPQHEQLLNALWVSIITAAMVMPLLGEVLDSGFRVLLLHPHFKMLAYFKLK